MPKIEIPSVEKINKFPWASVSYFMMGIIVFLLYVVINDSGGKQCEMDKAAANARADRAQEQTVKILQENIAYARKQDSIERANRELRDTVNEARRKLTITSTLTRKAVKVK